MNNFTNSSSVISSDTVIKGKIDFKGELLIEGKASGDILGDNLTLGPSAKVDGKIIVKAITVQGISGVLASYVLGITFSFIVTWLIPNTWTRLKLV